MGDVNTSSRAVVFSDFDGTITQEETFSLLMKTFAPEASALMIPRLLSGEITLREGVPAVVETIPSSRFPDMLEFMKKAKLRPGFESFLEKLAKRSIPFIVLSGSLEPLVMATLAPFQSLIHRVVAAAVDSQGPFLHVSSPHARHDELVYKPGILSEYPGSKKIVIGDSVTDYSMARAGDIVFARSLLAQDLVKSAIPYHKFETFFDISNNIDKIQEKEENSLEAT